jgi:hypothetical protein
VVTVESLLAEIVKSSPILGMMIIFWYYQRKDYAGLVQKTQDENLKREEKYQSTIEKLTDKLSVVNDMKDDVEEIKDFIFKK